MKTLPRLTRFIPGINLTFFFLLFFMLAHPWKASAFFASVSGPSYTCPNSELIYEYDDDYGGGDVLLCITNGQIFNTVTQTWVTCWEFYEGNIAVANFRVRWDNAVNGTIGNIHIRICDHTFTFICSNGDKNVTFGPSPGTPIISGSNYILNCSSQQQSYTPVSLPESWQLVSWNYSSNIQSVNGTLNPKLVQATSTTSNEMATLTGVFNFTTGGVTCATQNVGKSIWLGKPSIISQTLNGGSYFPGSQICPGNHWVGVSWNGLVGSTSWNVTPGISYYSNNTTCNFTLPSSGYSSVSITVNATNSCGTSSNTSFYLSKKTYGCGSFLVSASPNPATSDLTIRTSLVSETEGIQYEAIADAVYLVDESNTKVISIVPSDASFNLDTRQIKNGTYFLHTRFGKDEFVKRIIIKN